MSWTAVHMTNTVGAFTEEAAVLHWEKAMYSTIRALTGI